jgi:glycosyltransferase involved in cell wall biosynthesis
LNSETTSHADRRRVLVILSSLRAEGTPRLVLDLCREWRRLGIEPLVLTLFARPADLIAEYSAETIPVQCMEWPSKGWRRYFRLTLTVRRLCKQNNIHGVVSMPLGWHLFAGIGASLGGKVPLLAHAGNAPASDGGGQWYRFFLEVQLARLFTTKIVCCSEYVQEALIRAFRLSRFETETVPNGINVSGWNSEHQRELGSPNHGYYILVMVGTLEGHKDQGTLIDAMPLIMDHVRKRGQRAQLWLVGEGSMRDALHDRAGRQGLSENVIFHGSRTDVKQLLQAADFFVFSTTEREGQGIALLEAMASGLPIVATDVGACREVLDNGDCGVLVPPNAPGELADAIISLIDQPKRATVLARNAKKRVHELYHVRQTAIEYARLLGLIPASESPSN